MTLLYVSTVLLWIAVVALSLLLFALARQIGVLHERIAPLGALMLDQGPKVGEPAPLFELPDIFGRPVRLGGKRDRAVLLLFASSTCPVCKKVLPIAKTLAREEGLDLVVVGDESPEALTRFAEANGLREHTVINAPEVGRSYRIGKIPYAVLIDREGTIRSKGLVNSREHLESLMEAYRLGVASIQDFLAEGGTGWKG